VVNADDPVSASLKAPPLTVTYSLEKPADYTVGPVTIAAGRQRFRVARGGAEPAGLGEFSLAVPGRFNVANALAAAAAATELGVKPEVIRAALADFQGIWRRFEMVAGRNGAPIYSDYGHHPSAIRGTLAAAHEFHPKKRIILAFQPHQHNRTSKLFDEFVASMDGADAVVLSEIFDVAGREEAADQAVSSRDLVEALKKRDAGRGVTRPLIYAESLPRTVDELKKMIGPDDVVVMMGAGDIYKIADDLRS